MCSVGECPGPGLRKTVLGNELAGHKVVPQKTVAIPG